MPGPERFESNSAALSDASSLLLASVVIPTCNRLNSLKLTLKAIFTQKRIPQEVIIVDDHSSDNTSVAVERLLTKKLPFNLVYLKQKRNLGPAAARNLGVMNAKYDCILFTDDDCEPDSIWAEALTRQLYTSPQLAGVGGPVLSAERSKFGLFFDYHRMLDPKFVNDSPVYLVTANAAYKKDWILKVGGFNEGLSRPGGEDPGLSFKISAAGGKFGFAPQAVVRHHYTSKYSSVARMFWNYGFGGCHVALANTDF
jgi:glycosyltransferase involved in cell wall biosynthesis